MRRTLRWALFLLLAALVCGAIAGAVAIAAFPRAILEQTGYSAATERLVTGILVTGTPARPVLYVTSSDPRTGAANRRDRSMDTNSGIVSRLTWAGDEWRRVDLVRGLPRSRQDHATNGLALDPATRTLYVAQGSNTNRGAPSESFGLLPEYALSGSVLAIDLDRIGDGTYDLPTPSGGAPFGGESGANQATTGKSGPVRLFATGLRNPYDLVRTRSGALFATVNGANEGRGARPAPGCADEPREGGSRGDDALVRIEDGAFYGHPNPERKECGDPTVSPLAEFPFSTNGVVQVYAGPLAGDLLTVSFEGTLHRLGLTDVEDRVVTHEAVRLAGIPLDVAAQGTVDPLPGTVWVALYVNGRGKPGGLAVLEPADLGRAGAWTTLAGSGSPRQEVSYVAYGGELYLAGGDTRQQVYDPRTGVWRDVAPLQERLDHIQGAVVGDRIYYVGGLRRWPDEEVGSVQVYDPATDRFAEGPSMPRPRGAGGVAVHGGKLYYAGGLHQGQAVAWLDVLDPATGRWTELPDMPRARDHFQAVVVGDRLLVTGGRDRDIGTELAETDAYDIGERRWITGLAPIPTPRGGFGAAAIDGEMIVIGGEVSGKALPTVEAYRPARDTWRTLPSMPTARHGIQAAVCGGQVLVAAGGVRMGGGPADTHEALGVGSAPCGEATASNSGTMERALQDAYVVGTIAGADPIHPTSLQLGPDGRLYVAQQSGTILAYTVRRRAAGAYEVTATEAIDAIRRIPNHDDDGSSATDVGSLLTVIRDKLGM